MGSISVEDYLKTIWKLEYNGTGKRVKTKDIAAKLNLALPSVTSMLKTLARQEYLDYVPYQGVFMTESGRKEALKVIRKHRLLELFLMETLELDWAEVHEEAELLEHALSERLTERIDRFLGHPRIDPHGDPIPTAEGVIARVPHRPLSEQEPGTSARVMRVLAQERAFLEYLQEKNLVIGAELTVVEHEPFGGPIMIKVLPEGNLTGISRDVACLLLVEAHNPA